MIKKICLLLLIASCASTTLPFFETKTETMFKLYAKISEIIKSLTTKKTSYATTLTTIRSSNNKKQGEVFESTSLPEFKNNQSSTLDHIQKKPKNWLDYVVISSLVAGNLTMLGLIIRELFK